MSFSVRAALDQFTLSHPSGERHFTISVAALATEQDAEKMPVLYVVDGDFVFGLAAEIVRILTSMSDLPACWVVGIGYDAPYDEFLKLRTADLSPPIRAEALETLGAIGPAIGGANNGGADALLAFLTNVLRPEIASRYPQTAGGEQILFGHSLGGLSAAHSLLTRPDAFGAFLISSPSLWWDDFSIFAKLPAFAQRLSELPAQPRVFIDVGGKEQDLPQSVPDGLGVTLADAQAQVRAARMVDAAEEFANALRDAGVASLRHTIFAQEDHISVTPSALLHGLRFALGHEI